MLLNKEEDPHVHVFVNHLIIMAECARIFHLRHNVTCKPIHYILQTFLFKHQIHLTAAIDEVRKHSDEITELSNTINLFYMEIIHQTFSKKYRSATIGKK